MTIAEFFTRDMSGKDGVIFRASEMPDVGTGKIEYRLVAASRSESKNVRVVGNLRAGE